MEHVIMDTFMRKWGILQIQMDSCCKDFAAQAKGFFAGEPHVMIQADVRGAFENFDNDGDGHMDIKELRAALEFLDLPCSPQQVDYIMEKFDGDGNSTLELEEFQLLINYFRQLAEMEAAAVDIANRVTKRRKRTA